MSNMLIAQLAELSNGIAKLKKSMDELKQVIGGTGEETDTLNYLLKDLNENRIGDINTENTLNWLVNQLNARIRELNEQRIGDINTENTLNYLVNLLNSKLDVTNQKLGDASTDNTVIFELNETVSKLTALNNKIGDVSTENTVLERLQKVIEQIGDEATSGTLIYGIKDLRDKLGDTATADTVLYELDQTVSKLTDTISRLDTLNNKIGDVSISNTVLERLQKLIDQMGDESTSGTLIYGIKDLRDKIGDVNTANTLIERVNKLVSQIGDVSTANTVLERLQALITKMGDEATDNTVIYELDQTVSKLSALNSKIGDTSSPNTVLERLQKVIDQIGDETTSGTLIYGIKDLRNKIGDTATAGTTNYLLDQLNAKIGDINTPNTLNYLIKDLNENRIGSLDKTNSLIERIGKIGKEGTLIDVMYKNRESLIGLRSLFENIITRLEGGAFITNYDFEDWVDERTLSGWTFYTIAKSSPMVVHWNSEVIAMGMAYSGDSSVILSTGNLSEQVIKTLYTQNAPYDSGDHEWSSYGSVYLGYEKDLGSSYGTKISAEVCVEAGSDGSGWSGGGRLYTDPNEEAFICELWEYNGRVARAYTSLIFYTEEFHLDHYPIGLIDVRVENMADSSTPIIVRVIQSRDFPDHEEIDLATYILSPGEVIDTKVTVPEPRKTSGIAVIIEPQGTPTSENRCKVKISRFSTYPETDIAYIEQELTRKILTDSITQLGFYGVNYDRGSLYSPNAARVRVTLYYDDDTSNTVEFTLTDDWAYYDLIPYLAAGKNLKKLRIENPYNDPNYRLPVIDLLVNTFSGLPPEGVVVWAKLVGKDVDTGAWTEIKVKEGKVLAVWG